MDMEVVDLLGSTQLSSHSVPGNSMSFAADDVMQLEFIKMGRRGVLTGLPRPRVS